MFGWGLLVAQNEDNTKNEGNSKKEDNPKNEANPKMKRALF